MKLVKFASIALAILMLTTSVGMAVEGGNPKKGKYLYKKKCKSCHGEDGQGGELTPMSKTMAQWDRMFKKSGEECSKKAGGLKEKDLRDINQFLYDHAADSDQPQTCG